MGTHERMGRFLRQMRAEVTPAAAGLPDLGRRRVPGLRREEVALLAGVSPTYYTRLEQGLPVNASVSVLSAIGRALGLDAAEMEHLLNLAGARPSPRAVGPASEQPEEARESTLRLLHAMKDVPALLLGRSTDVLAWNVAGHALVGSHLPFEAPERAEERPNLTRMLFLDAPARALYADWDEEADRATASLKLLAGRSPEDASIASLVRELLVAAPAFAARWEQPPVALCQAGVKALRHPELGAVTVSFEMLALTDGSGQRLLTYTAAPGSRDEALLASLRTPRPAALAVA